MLLESLTKFPGGDEDRAEFGSEARRFRECFARPLKKLEHTRGLGSGFEDGQDGVAEQGQGRDAGRGVQQRGVVFKDTEKDGGNLRRRVGGGSEQCEGLAGREKRRGF